MPEQGSSGRSVLIVDNDSEIRELLKRFLEPAGYEVVGEAINGEEAIVKASELQPDFVLLDYDMPIMTGEAAAGRIRDVVPSARIVAVSGSVTSKPEWSDAFLNKTGLAMVSELLDIID